MDKPVKAPPSNLSPEWEAPRVVLERIVMRRGSLRGLGQHLGRSTMFLWRQLRQNKGFNLFTIGEVLAHLGVPARFFYEQILDLSPPYDPAWVLEHFREESGAPRDPFLAAVSLRFSQLAEKATARGRRRRRRGEIESLEDRSLFEKEATKADLEKLGRDLLLSAEAAASGDRGLECGQLADCGHCLVAWGALQQVRRHRNDSMEAFVLGYRLAMAAGDSKVVGRFYSSAAHLLAELGQPGSALRFAEHACRLLLRQRDRRLRAQAFLRLSLLLRDLGRNEESRAEALTALRFAGRDHSRIRASVWLQLSHLAQERGSLRQALAMVGWAKKHARGAEDLGAFALWREGVVLGRLGRPRAAKTALLAAIEAFEKGAQPREAARVSVDLVEVLIRTGRTGDARKMAQALTPSFEQLAADSPALALWLDLLALILQASWGPCLEHVVQLREALRPAESTANARRS